MQPAPMSLAAVPQGPLAYRRQLRRLGGVAGLLPPALMGVLGLAALYHNESSLRGAVGFVLAAMAAPCLLVGGAPLATGSGLYTVAIVGSIVVWLATGVVAARRATAVPAADWRDYWREYLWLAGGVWLGVVGALVAVDLVLGRPFL